MTRQTQQQQSRPAVSVIVPNHNSARFLPRGVRSILAQGPDVEVIVVDDCSTEDPAPALEQFGSRVRLIRLAVNSGPSVARNTGAAAASGAVLAFVDADDWWPADFLSQVMPKIAPRTAVGYDNYRVPEADLTDPTPMVIENDSLLREWFDTGPSTVTRSNLQTLLTIPSLFKLLVHRDDFNTVKGFDSRYRGEEDLHFCVKLAAAGVGLEIVDHPKGYYLVRRGSILRSIETDAVKNLSSLRSWWQMFRDLPNENRLPPEAAAECRRLCQYYRARHTDAAIMNHLRRGRVLPLLGPSFVASVLPAVPGIIGLKVRGLARRVGAISKSASFKRRPAGIADPKS